MITNIHDIKINQYLTYPTKTTNGEIHRRFGKITNIKKDEVQIEFFLNKVGLGCIPDILKVNSKGCTIDEIFETKEELKLAYPEYFL